MHRAELLRSSTNGKTGIHVNGLRGFCQAVACTVSPFLLFSSLPCLLLLLLSFLLLFPLLSIRLSFPSSPAPLLPVPSCFFSFSLFERAASFLFRAASDPRISVIRAASLEERERDTLFIDTSRRRVARRVSSLSPRSRERSAKCARARAAYRASS